MDSSLLSVHDDAALDMVMEGRSSQIRYVVISPVRNEAAHLEATIRSMVNQTIPPVQWIIVNDGSTDATAEILDRWTALHSWIVPVHLAGRDSAGVESKRTRGQRAFEAKEITAFHAGFTQLASKDWDYIVKLDGDLGFEPDYFERCLAAFAADPKLGIGGGVICHQLNGKLQVEPTPRFHVRGATKIYRRNCWMQIDGVINGAAWDTIDEVKANMFGWKTQTFPDLKVTHFRFTGTANGAWQNAVKIGSWSYVSGYHPLYIFVRAVKWISEKPYFVSSLGMLYGFLSAWIRRVPQIDQTVLRYLREQQLRRLAFRSTIWD
jgi:poly-beta-1,6-N-acetyl-D-glucosamine synthase